VATIGNAAPVAAAPEAEADPVPDLESTHGKHAGEAMPEPENHETTIETEVAK
jgi:hypothetical protein